jgi:hypothetical protein
VRAAPLRSHNGHGYRNSHSVNGFHAPINLGFRARGKANCCSA